MAPIEIPDIGVSTVRAEQCERVYTSTVPADNNLQVLGSRQSQEDRYSISKLGTLAYDKSLACFAVYDGQYVVFSPNTLQEIDRASLTTPVAAPK